MARPSTKVLKRRARSGIRRFKEKYGAESFEVISSAQKISYENIRRYGKPFIGGFRPSEFKFGKETFGVALDRTMYESPIRIVLSGPTKIPGFSDLIYSRLGYVKLNFDHGAVLIEAVQGVRGAVKALKHFEKGVGMPWPNFIIKKIEAVARRLGYKQARFRDVESLRYYQEPSFDIDLIDSYRSQHPETKGINHIEVRRLVEKQVQDRMKKLYSSLYSGLGYTRREGDYWVKDL
ncbi:MAG TPA: hypothetical protein VI977_01970 [archaeon]|nr:hypothetical protein [archaeon]